jgi:BolA protein
MNVKSLIEAKLAEQFHLLHMDVVDESHMHNVPAGAQSHFKVVLVSDDFVGKRLVARHQAVYRALEGELRGAVHALGLHTFTGEEWQARHAAAPMSPPCMGGGKQTVSG